MWVECGINVSGAMAALGSTDDTTELFFSIDQLRVSAWCQQRMETMNPSLIPLVAGQIRSNSLK